jgi:hypothetical protein
MCYSLSFVEGGMHTTSYYTVFNLTAHFTYHDSCVQLIRRLYTLKEMVSPQQSLVTTPVIAIDHTRFDKM